jgi:hypothetical protein
LTRKGRAGAPEACQYFVGDEQRAVAARDARGAPQPALGLGNHAGGALHQRFEDKGRVGITLFLLRGEFLFENIGAFPMALAVEAGIGAFGLGAVERATVTIRRRRAVGLEEQSGVAL